MLWQLQLSLHFASQSQRNYFQVFIFCNWIFSSLRNLKVLITLLFASLLFTVYLMIFYSCLGVGIKATSHTLVKHSRTELYPQHLTIICITFRNSHIPLVGIHIILFSIGDQNVSLGLKMNFKISIALILWSTMLKSASCDINTVIRPSPIIIRIRMWLYRNQDMAISREPTLRIRSIVLIF